jgi:hypothetical protein
MPRLLRAVLALVAATVIHSTPASAQILPIVGGRDSTYLTLNGRQWEPFLFSIRLHGVVQGADQPYYVLSGFECSDCDAPRRLTILPFGAKSDATHLAYYYPGTVSSESDPRGFIRSRAFIGVCGTDSIPRLIVVQSEKGRHNRWVSRTVRIRVGSAGLEAKTTPGRASAERAAEGHIARNECLEVPPIALQLEG